MDAELKRYLNAIVILLCLNVGFFATFLWVSAETMSFTFFLFPILGAILVGWFVWLAAEPSA